MKNKKIVIILIIVLLSLAGMAFGVYYVMDSVKKDKQETQKRMDEVTIYYQSFAKNVENFNKKRTEFETSTKDIYYTNLNTNYTKIVKILEQYDEIVGLIQQDSAALKERCKAYYIDTTINQYCTTYKLNFETAMTVFRNDVEAFNQLITTYNNWTKENPSYKTLSLYTAKNIG